MNNEQWYRERDDRVYRYGATPLDPSRWICIKADPEYAATYEGQVAILTAAVLFGRMSPSVAIDVPREPIVDPLPWAGNDLQSLVLGRLYEADQRGRFDRRQPRDGDVIISIGPVGPGMLVHGAGWCAYVGHRTSPLSNTQGMNPVGSALAVIIAAALLFGHDLTPPACEHVFNAFDWSHDPQTEGIPILTPEPALGNLWAVGTGSVGTVILYFLSLLTRNFTADLFDMDRVKRQNITRSPIFTENYIGQHKVAATKAYLESCGLVSVTAHPWALHRSARWKERQDGTPDLLISAANEMNVRHIIESQFPPVQIYGTTGEYWQAMVARHIPLRDACSCCVFPDTTHTPTQCATDTEHDSPKTGDEEQVDAALPFLSFAAGLMATAEILKLTLPGYPFTPNRTFLNTKGMPRLVSARIPRRTNCICGARSESVYQQVLGSSRFAALSGRKSLE